MGSRVFFCLALLAVPVLPALPGAGAWTRVPIAGANDVVAHGGDMWVIGANELIAVSPDFGKTWSVRHKRNGGEWVLSLSFVGDKTVIATGTGGLLVKSTDQGQTWKSIGGVRPTLSHAQFLDRSNGFAYFYNSLEFTTDGGVTWFSRDAGADIQSLAALDAQHAMAATYAYRAPTPGTKAGEGVSRLVVTTDGGGQFLSGPPPLGVESAALYARDGTFYLDGFSNVAHQGARLAFTSADGKAWRTATPAWTGFGACHTPQCLGHTHWVRWQEEKPEIWAMPDVQPFEPVDFGGWAVAVAGDQGMVCVVAAATECAPSSRVEEAQADTNVSTEFQNLAPPDMPPMPISTPDPDYPRAAQPPGKNVYHVLARIMIDNRGHEVASRILEAQSAPFAEETKKALARWQFQPATRSGVAEATTVEVDVEFHSYTGRR